MKPEGCKKRLMHTRSQWDGVEMKWDENPNWTRKEAAIFAILFVLSGGVVGFVIGVLITR